MVTFIIAEVGINHNRDVKIAKKLTDEGIFVETIVVKFWIKPIFY